MDPEVKRLQEATARAYEAAEQLARELQNTVADLMSHIADPNQTEQKKAQ